MNRNIEHNQCLHRTKALASVRPDNGPDVDMDVLGFLRDMTDFDAFYPRMSHDLFCRPP